MSVGVTDRYRIRLCLPLELGLSLNGRVRVTYRFLGYS